MSPHQKQLLQASRGVAACLVMLFHLSSMSFKYFHYNLFGLNGLIRSGGVDYFFVLTGFLIYSIYGMRIGTRQKVWPYLANRLLRIYPFYWLITLLVLPVYFLVPSYGFGFETHKDEIIESLLLIPQAHGPIVQVAWSLSYFILFYAVFALSMALNRRWALFMVSVWIFFTLANFFNLPLLGPDIRGHFYLSFFFSETNLEFFIGCAVAHWSRTHHSKHGALWLVSGIIGFPLIWLNNKFALLPIHDYLLYVVPSALVLIGLVSIQAPDRNPSSWLQKLSKLGDASYSILLTHLLSISIMMKLFNSTGISRHLSSFSLDMAILVVTLLICYLIYHMVEKPLVSGLKSAFKLRSPKMN